MAGIRSQIQRRSTEAKFKAVIEEMDREGGRPM
ncbi:hypothetical protein PC116_g32283 [Phytophthora cactorum]|nr:hypothetical protein PC116_g32283 [Phytophthora cactorum]